MKFQITLALAAVCVANAGKLQNEAQAFAEKANPISKQSQAKIQKAAKTELNRFANLAQNEGAKYGIDFDFGGVFASLKKEYGGQVQSAVKQAAVKAESFAKNAPAAIENNQNFAKAEKLAEKATFNGILNKLTNVVKEQVKNIDNKQVKNSLNNIVNQGAAEARKAMKDANIGLKQNIKNTVVNGGEQFVNGNKAEWKKQAAAQKKVLNQKINQNL